MGHTSLPLHQIEKIVDDNNEWLWLVIPVVKANQGPVGKSGEL